jgi:hypothetical protein
LSALRDDDLAIEGEFLGGECGEFRDQLGK